ncbi:site-specific DNA-methyltransferase [Candidatus Saccharibacteria bacterium]|nr:site-specific DNA-methyltransferase [Candidatus Saccharibacteria bacterium]
MAAATSSGKNEIYIGDNLTVMKSDTFKKYHGLIGLIYIDPPYNTQTSRSYNDKNDSNTWYDFMHERLIEAKELLRDDAVILISIDDNEYASLKLCCDDVFGMQNFVGTMITKQAQRSNAKLINTVHEYVLCYAKDKKKLGSFSIKRMDIPEQKHMIEGLQKEIKDTLRESGKEIAAKALSKRIKQICEEDDITWLRNYSNIDDDGKIFFAVDLSTPGEPRTVDIPEIGLHLDPLPTRGWTTDARFIELYKAKRLAFKNGRPYSVRYLSESKDNVPSILNFYSRQGTHDLKRLGLQDVFDTPKPVEMLKFFIRMTDTHDSIVLDFFGGSGSTGQAVYETNDEDDRQNRYILIQLDEEVNRKSKAFNKCKELGIEPSIDKILEFRLKKFLESRGKAEDFVVIK